MRMERKQLDFELKVHEGDGPGEMSGYAAITSTIDRDGEVIRPGAFKHLEKLLKHGFGTVGHSWGALSIGTVEEAREDEKGLFFRMKFHSTQAAQDARTVIKERVEREKAVGLSIGYMVVKSSREQVEGKTVRFLDELDVEEIAYAQAPAHLDTDVTAVKSAEPLAGKELHDELDSALAAVESTTKRCVGYAATKKADERSMSEERITQMKALRDAMQASAKALDEVIPADMADDDAVQAEMAAHEAYEGRLAGLID